MRMIHSGITVAMVFVLGSVASMAQSSGQHAQGRRIEGTWVVDLRFADCQTGVEAASATSPALHTFLAGGSMLSDPAVSPVALGTGHGVWQHAGGRTSRTHWCSFGSIRTAVMRAP